MTKANKHQAPQIIARPIEALIPYARNARTHSDEQVALIAASLREFGWTNPVLVDAEGGIIAGHGRVMAARKLAASGATIPNWPDAAQVPTIALGHLTKAQRRAYVLADNQLATRSGWDAEILAVELDELRDEGFDLDLIGFERAELNDLIGTPNSVEPTEHERDVDAADKWTLLVEYPNEQQLAAAFDQAQKEGLPCKIIQ
jgi:ParB-like chromosome segregation protein Spo0J